MSQLIFKNSRKWGVLSWMAEKAWDILSGVAKVKWIVLSRVVNLCGMFCLGCQKWHGMFCPRMFWPIFIIFQSSSRIVLSALPKVVQKEDEKREEMKSFGNLMTALMAKHAEQKNTRVQGMKRQRVN